MALIRGKDWWWNYFQDNFYELATHIRGNVVLPFGYNEITVPVGKKISQVFLHDYPGSAIPVCQGDLNCLSCINTDYDFTIYADIKSNYTTIYWIVELEDE